jgi:hypothetical protein
MTFISKSTAMLFQQVPFKDEPLAIDGKGLVMTHWKEAPSMRYEKE